MNYQKLGQTDIEISSIGLGCMGMSQSYGVVFDDEESIATLHRALDLGVTFWDTADIYGNGANESLISKVLEQNRKKIVLATKFGFTLKDEKGVPSDAGNMVVDASPKHIKTAVEKSLKRLKTDVIDLYYAHRLDPNVPVEDTVGAMAELVKEGKVRAIGLSECSAESLKRAAAVHPIAALQSEYSLFFRDVEKEILPLTKTLGTTFVPFSPLGRGMLTGALNLDSLGDKDMRKNLPRYNGGHRKNNELLVAGLTELAASKNIKASQLALAWVLAQGDNIAPIPGTKRRKYLEENAAASDVRLSAEDLQKIEGLLKKYPDMGARYSEKETKFLKK